MKLLAFIALHDIFSVFFLWVLYLAVMNLKRANDISELTGAARFAALFIKQLGILWDAYVNIFVFTRYMLDFPREWLVTDRMIRYVNRGDFRERISNWICSHLLDPFDPSGCHCKNNLNTKN